MFLHKHKSVTSFLYANKNSSFLLKSLVYLKDNFSTSTRKKNQPTVSEILINKHNFSHQLAEKVELFRSINPERADSILSFLKETGFSNTQLEKMMESKNRVLAYSLENVIKPKIKIFQDLGFSSKDIAEIIGNYPDILHRSTENRVVPAILVLKGLLGSHLEVVKLLKVSCWYLRYDTKTTLLPNVDFLKSCGIPVEYVTWLMYNFPRALLCKPEKLRRCVCKVDETGIERSSKMYVHAIRVLTQMTSESWELKLQAIRDLGFSEAEVVAAFRSAPQVFCISVEKMKKIKEVVIGTEVYDFSCIVNFPTVFICSVEKRLKPRAEVLRVLKRKSLIEGWPSFSAFHRYTDDQFFKKYVAPNLDEVNDVWLGTSALTGKK